jgi:four helix bundle protein
MKTESILKQKSYAFALKVVETCRFMVNDKKEFVISKQFLKAGTAIGALVREAEFAQSRSDFISKLSIALKESNEADYWISLLKDSEILDVEKAVMLENTNKELIRILVSSIKTAKEPVKIFV